MLSTQHANGASPRNYSRPNSGQHNQKHGHGDLTMNGYLIAHKIFVGGLAEESTDDDLKKLFGQFAFAGVTSTRIITDVSMAARNGEPRRYAFVEFRTPEEVQRVLVEATTADLNLHGRRLNVGQAYRKMSTFGRVYEPQPVNASPKGGNRSCGNGGGGGQSPPTLPATAVRPSVPQGVSASQHFAGPPINNWYMPQMQMGYPYLGYGYNPYMAAYYNMAAVANQHPGQSQAMMGYGGYSVGTPSPTGSGSPPARISPRNSNMIGSPGGGGSGFGMDFGDLENNPGFAAMQGRNVGLAAQSQPGNFGQMYQHYHQQMQNQMRFATATAANYNGGGYQEF